jgi:CYTH domain-containing protein
MKQTERERVFLVKKLPEDLGKYTPVPISVGDFFDVNSNDALKIRQKGSNYQLIKKETNSAQERIEHIINIKKGEFDILSKCTVQFHRKNRYLYPFGKYTVEVDCYQDSLDGYVRAEVEFETDEEMNNFILPEWFGEEITEINHEIHKNLGIINFDEMKGRYAQRGIILNKIFVGSGK